MFHPAGSRKGRHAPAFQKILHRSFTHPLLLELAAQKVGRRPSSAAKRVGNTVFFPRDHFPAKHQMRSVPAPKAQKYKKEHLLLQDTVHLFPGKPVLFFHIENTVLWVRTYCFSFSYLQSAFPLTYIVVSEMLQTHSGLQWLPSLFLCFLGEPGLSVSR